MKIIFNMIIINPKKYKNKTRKINKKIYKYVI